MSHGIPFSIGNANQVSSLGRQRPDASAKSWVCRISAPVTRAREWGLSWRQQMDARLEVEFLAQLADARARDADRVARRRVVCGAKTRKSGACRNKSEPGKQRCNFHGGKSTGPKTVEGKSRIAEAQRLRWAKHRADACHHLTGRAQGATESPTRLHSRTGANDSAS